MTARGPAATATEAAGRGTDPGPTLRPGGCYRRSARSPAACCPGGWPLSAGSPRLRRRSQNLARTRAGLRVGADCRQARRLRHPAPAASPRCTKAGSRPAGARPRPHAGKRPYAPTKRPISRRRYTHTQELPADLRQLTRAERLVVRAPHGHLHQARLNQVEPGESRLTLSMPRAAQAGLPRDRSRSRRPPGRPALNPRGSRVLRQRRRPALLQASRGSGHGERAPGAPGLWTALADRFVPACGP